MKIKDILSESEFLSGKGEALIDSNGNFPKYGYRVMHHNEWDQAKVNKYFYPSQQYGFLFVSAEALDMYKTKNGELNYVVQFKLTPKDGWKSRENFHGEIYGATDKKVPFSRASIVKEI